MHFLITAYDATDEGALDRRMETREAHLETIARYKESGNILIGAAILDENDKMVGSSIIASFDSEDGLHAWLEEEPFVVGDVWDEITVTKCAVGPSFLK